MSKISEECDDYRDILLVLVEENSTVTHKELILWAKTTLNAWRIYNDEGIDNEDQG